MTTAMPAPPQELGYVGQFVHQTITRLQRGYLDDHSAAVAELARLRRGVGKPAGAAPDLWGLTADESLYGRQSRRERLRKPDPDCASDAEAAAHIALTLYATHQQSHHGDRMHVRGCALGAAVRRLMPPGDIEESIRRRFVQAGNAHTVEVLAQRLRELVLLLRRAGIPLDYGLLADQLEMAQDPERREWVRRAWGRSFHAYRPPRTGGPNTPAAAVASAAPAAPDDGTAPTPMHTAAPAAAQPDTTTEPDKDDA
jgi:CRISPR system Cascade subunit CasB